MCGRFVRKTNIEEIATQFSVDCVSCDIPFSFNIAPSQKIAVITGKSLVEHIWGLTPPWKSSGLIINVRSETVETKPFFSESFALRRCLIPADGFYEWKQEPNKKIPFFIHLKDNTLFAFAGLWFEKEGQCFSSVLTTAPNTLLNTIHNRMPVIVTPSCYNVWLDNQSSLQEIIKILAPYPSGQMEMHQVDARVNHTSNNDENCIKPYIV